MALVMFAVLAVVLPLALTSISHLFGSVYFPHLLHNILLNFDIVALFKYVTLREENSLTELRHILQEEDSKNVWTLVVDGWGQYPESSPSTKRISEFFFNLEKKICFRHF